MRRVEGYCVDSIALCCMLKRSSDAGVKQDGLNDTNRLHANG